jgi:hypothetical protein
MRKGAVKFRILPVNREDCFTIKLLAEDREVAWSINVTYAAMIFRAVFVTMPGGMTVATNEVVGVSGYDGDTM